MDKNTIWAIVLSTAVIGGFIFFQQKFMMPTNQQTAPADVEKNADTSASGTAAQTASPSSDVFNTADTLLPAAADTEAVPDQTVTITTDKVKVTFTNKGGDIVSYELVDHIDKLTGKGVELADNISAFNRACAVSFGDQNSALLNENFSVEQSDADTVLFTRHYNGFTFGKRYTFKPGEYIFKLEIMVHSDSGTSKLDFNNAAYTLRTSPQIGPHFNQKTDKYEMRQFISFNGDKKKTITVSTKQFKSYDKSFTWNGIAGNYFEVLVIPENPANISTTYYSSKIEVNDYANAQAFLVRKSFDGADLKDSYYMYFGPRNEKDLKRYNIAANNAWGLDNLKLAESLQSSGWLSWLENILKWIMEMLYKLIPNWGVSIIIMTILFKIAMFPLTKKQSMSTLKMQDLPPKMTAIQTKYKDNPQKMQEEMGKLYKENNYNPASGCLPMLLQFLIIFAMYNLFNNYFEFRGASFIPGCIPDLSAWDSVHTFKKSLPFLGNAIRILPIIYLASQLLYGKITMNGGTAAGNGTSAGQMKFMMYGMPVIFFFIFYNAPSGLLLYWTVSNLIQMGQQLIINKIMAQKKNEIAAQKNEKTAAIAKKQGKK